MTKAFWSPSSKLSVTALLLLCAASTTACSAAWSFTSWTDEWSEDVALHDGRFVKVEREEYWTTKLHFTDSFFGLPTVPYFRSQGADRYWLKFEHPDTRETIRWKGERHYEPVLLDIVDGVPYLVAFGGPNKSTEKIYGCPELPYVFLKYEKGIWGQWTPIPVEAAPQVLRNSNLSLPPSGNRQPHAHWSSAFVQETLLYHERQSHSHFQRSIPRNYDEWNSGFKNGHRNERKVWDCRPPLQPLPDVPLPKPVDVELEVVETQDYVVTSADQYYKSLAAKKGAITRDNCAKLFRPPNPEALMQGERFINDPTGNIRLPYSRPAPSPSGRAFEARVQRYCDDKFVWFVDGYEEPGKTIITKYAASGNLLYNIRMDDPKIAGSRSQITGIKPHINMVLDSLSTENGNLYFYWVHELPLSPDSPNRYPNRMTKYRFLEPILEDRSK